MVWSVSEAAFDGSVAATVVTYPAGAARSSGAVVGTARVVDGGSTGQAVVLDVTAAHPVSPTWPDQPADRGFLRCGDRDLPLLDVVQGVVADGALTLHTTAARLGGGVDVVVHVVAPVDVEIGAVVGVVVDEPFRRALSLAHSACHLAALALDAAVAPLWTRPVDRVDPLGHPAFDQIAIASSTLTPHHAVDVYRLGKSLRKKGFDAARLDADLSGAVDRQRAHVQRWIAEDVPLRVVTGDGTLSDRRSWQGRLDGVDVEIPCGGTHVASTAELAGMESTLRLAPLLDELVMETVLPAAR